MPLFVKGDNYQSYFSKFFEKVKTRSENFKGLTEEKYETFKQIASNIKISDTLDITTPIDYYFYLVNYINKKELSYDDKTLLIILTVDPEFKILSLYNKTVTITQKYVNDKNNKNEKDINIKERQKQIEQFRSLVRNEFGYYPPYIIDFEIKLDKYMAKFKETLITGVKKTELFSVPLKEIDFEPLNEKELNEIKEAVKTYKEENIKYAYYDVIYQLIYQTNRLNIKRTPTRILMFLIMLFDPELKGLDIYEEESNWKQIDIRLKELGVLNAQEFIYLEKQCITILNNIETNLKRIKTK